MRCPIDTNTDLQMTDRQGIEIDYCPKCRGVWLDRGELDKIIERSGSQNQPEPDRDQRDYQRDRDQHPSKDYGQRKRRGGFLGDLFDFD